MIKVVFINELRQCCVFCHVNGMNGQMQYKNVCNIVERIFLLTFEHAIDTNGIYNKNRNSNLLFSQIFKGTLNDSFVEMSTLKWSRLKRL